MDVKKSHRVKSVILLLFFIFLKLGIAHTLSHSLTNDDFDDCEQCEFIVSSNKLEPLDASVFSYENNLSKEDSLQKPVDLLYKNPNFRDHHYFFHFNKPPPFLV